MAKVKVENSNKENSGKTSKQHRTMCNKAKKVIQSNGVKYFKEWADKTFSGGKKLKANRGSMKAAQPEFYRQLLLKYEKFNRAMDK